MIKLQGKDIYLAALEGTDCQKLYEDTQYNFDNPMEPTLFGGSIENAQGWYEEIQQLLKADVNIRVGIFLNDGSVIGDIALQGIDRINRSCSIGIGISKFDNQGKGYGTQAIALILEYAFNNQGFERITADTLEINTPAQKVLEKVGFVLEGRERKAIYFRRKKYDRLKYGLLIEDYTH